MWAGAAVAVVVHLQAPKLPETRDEKGREEEAF